VTDARSTECTAALPSSAWALAGVCLVGQLIELALRGVSDAELRWKLASMALTALIVCWVSAGVLRARRLPLVVAWLVFLVDLVFTVAAAIDSTSGRATSLLLVVVAAAQVAALAAFCRSAYYRSARSAPRGAARPSIAALVLVAAAVGMLGGLTAPTSGTDSTTQLRVGL